MAQPPAAGPVAPPSRRRRHPVRAFLVLVLGLVVLGVLLGGVTLARMRSDLVDGKSSLVAARRALLGGRIQEADRAFHEASDRFGGAASTADGLLGRLGSLLPAFGNNVTTAGALAEGGRHLATAGSDLTAALGDLPGGMDALAPSRGRLPLDVYARLSGTLADAVTEANEAVRAVGNAPSSFLLPTIRDARWDALEQATALTRSLDAGGTLLGGLPGFAGADGPRHYLVVAQNPAEIRGTGGLWGAYAILTLDHGRPSLSGAAPTQLLAAVTLDQIDGVSQDYRDNYDRFGGAASWQNINLTPDFPSAAVAALANYRAGEGTQLDGVIAADPFALASMLHVTGPMPVPGTDVRVRADTVVAFTTNGAYADFPKQVERKAILGAVSADVIGRFLAIDGKGLPRLRALATAIAGGHLLVYSADPVFEAGLRSTGAAGDFLTDAAAAPGDVVSLTVGNGSANKVDYYATRRVRYAVTLAPDGDATSTLEVQITNDAPTQGPPRYVLGPFVKGLGPGDARPLLTGWCNAPCALTTATRDGVDISVDSGTEGGQRWYRNYDQPIAAGDTGSLTLGWRTTGVWKGDTSSGVYRLLFLGQTTIRPTTLTISVRTPPGTTIVWSSLPMSVQDNVGTWEGTPGPRTELTVRFQAPTLTRWWRNADRAFG